MRTFRRRKKEDGKLETEEEKEQRKAEVLSILNDDKTFLKTQDVRFSDIVTIVVDDTGAWYTDRDLKKAPKGEFRIYKAFEIWTLDRLIENGVTPDRAMSILGVDGNG